MVDPSKRSFRGSEDIGNRAMVKGSSGSGDELSMIIAAGDAGGKGIRESD
jgi:hypothetical protein